MNIHIKPGRYVVAVSGGIDSMVLLHLLHGRPGVELTVAHFDHGMRRNSADDRRFVEDQAGALGLPFVYKDGKLGRGASEAAARGARYSFLHRVRQGLDADAVLTAHHKDDVLETAILNIIRGTGRRGLTSLGSGELVVRPLLACSKEEIKRYASEHQLVWRHDPTNDDTYFLRNHVRHKVLPRLGDEGRRQLYETIQNLGRINYELDQELSVWVRLNTKEGNMDRPAFTALPHAAAREVMAFWLRQHNIPDFDSKMLERLVVAAKIKEAGRRINVRRGAWVVISKDSLALVRSER